VTVNVTERSPERRDEGSLAPVAHPVPTETAPSSADADGAALPPEVWEELRRRAAAPPSPPAWRQRLNRFGPLGALLLFLLVKGKLLVGLLKFLKLNLLWPFFQTGGTMLLSIVVYADRWGWAFATGFVLSILVHELGHVFAAWRLGVPVTAPVFIPGMGALILQKRSARSAWGEALIGIGGPIGGTLAGLACLFAHQVTQDPFWLSLAYTGFLLNLFNLMPVFPLDGGWIVGAVSPRLWLVGLVGLGAIVLAGGLRNPFLLLLLLLSLPRVIHGIRTGGATAAGVEPATPAQRLVAGVAYLSLCGLLGWLVSSTHFEPE